MNRWFIAALITLALVFLVSPAIVGRLAERSVEENLNFAAGKSDEIVITTESFERGWFTSEGRHRIELGAGEIRSTIEGGLTDRQDIPSLIIDTHIDHGPLPITAISRDYGSLKPGLASTVSTMKLDPGNGQLIDLPGNIVSNVALTGQTTSRFLLEAGSRDLENVAIAWQGADIVLQTNPDSGSVSVKGATQPFSVYYEGTSIEFGDIVIVGEQRRSSYGFKVGNIQLEMGPVDIDAVDGVEGSIGSVTMLTSNEIDGDRVNSMLNLEILDVKAPVVGYSELVMNFVLNGVDAQSFQNISQAMKTTQPSADENDLLAGLYPEIEADLQKILVAGAELRLDRFEFTLPSGKLTSKLRFDIAPSKPDVAFSWPAVLLALNASADIRMPAALFDTVAAANPDIETLVAMGIFKQDGDFFEMRAKYAKGLLTVNGAPLPIPLQGM